MALQDLTPQLRTRLSRMERAVGWFVLLATLLLIFGFVYYIVVMAERKGWFVTKVNYQTSVQSAAGLKVGDPVKLMGYDVGEITRIEANRPYEYYNVTVYFWIKAPYYGYLWSDSEAKVAAADFLGGRFLEVTKGTQGVPTVDETEKVSLGKTNKVATGMLRRDYLLQRQDELLKQGNSMEDVFQDLNRLAVANKAAFYTNLTKDAVYWLDPAESPALTERLERVVTAVEKALPNFLQLTNSLAHVLTNASRITGHAEEVLANLRPVTTNLALITDNLRNPHGSLGEWLIPTNLNRQLTGALASATATFDTAHTNLTDVSSNLLISLENLANITSNLSAQVQVNSNILSSISAAVLHADELVQGLKRHWFLRSAFRSETNQSPANPPPPQLRSPKNQ